MMEFFIFFNYVFWGELTTSLVKLNGHFETFLFEQNRILQTLACSKYNTADQVRGWVRYRLS